MLNAIAVKLKDPKVTVQFNLMVGEGDFAKANHRRTHILETGKILPRGWATRTPLWDKSIMSAAITSVGAEEGVRNHAPHYFR